ncbi:MAG: thermonuclease family protein [Rhodospirillales bacterium]|nr:thermonuclease family protein [Rhodospirillales bacterium]
MRSSRLFLVIAAAVTIGVLAVLSPTTWQGVSSVGIDSLAIGEGSHSIGEPITRWATRQIESARERIGTQKHDAQSVAEPADSRKVRVVRGNDPPARFSDDGVRIVRGNDRPPHGERDRPEDDMREIGRTAAPVQVIDGDTFVKADRRLRLHGIDALEPGQNCRSRGRDWPCGRVSTTKLANRLGDRDVSCSERGTDRYGRIVAVCRQGGMDIGAWMVGEGWALADRRYSRVYVPRERRARAKGRGAWQGEFVPPWEWRRGSRLAGDLLQPR